MFEFSLILLLIAQRVSGTELEQATNQRITGEVKKILNYKIETDSSDF
jgi:hypothetical protein